MKIRFSKNDVVDTKQLGAVIKYAYVPGNEGGYDWLDQFIEVCNQVSSGGEKPIEMSVNSQGVLTITNS